MTASHVRLPPVSQEVQRRERLLDGWDRATSGGTGHLLRPAVVPAGTAFRRESGVTWRHARGADALRTEEDRMRLVAALLVLGTLLVWILFLQG